MRVTTALCGEPGGLFAAIVGSAFFPEMAWPSRPGGADFTVGLNLQTSGPTPIRSSSFLWMRFEPELGRLL